jgi:hypothetical protein
MRRWKIPTQFWAIVGATWLVGSAASGFLIYRVGSLCAAFDATFEKGISEFRQQDAARVIQVTFKKQVQEWKDALLRGSDLASLTKYTDAFHDREKTVRAAAEDLQRTATDPEVKALLSEFQQAHETMGSTYEKALSAFTEAKGKNQQETDGMVKGQDRAPTDLGQTSLQQVAEAIHGITESAIKVRVLVDEVKLSSQDQAHGVEQISKGMS